MQWFLIIVFRRFLLIQNMIEGDPVTADDLRGVLPKLQEFQPDAIIGVGRCAF